MSRPHMGLENPEKFGLTYEEVVELIETNKWRTFYANWYKKEQRKKARDNEKPWTRLALTRWPNKRKNGVPIETFRCSNCKTEFPLTENHFKIGKYAFICLECAKRIAKVV